MARLFDRVLSNDEARLLGLMPIRQPKPIPAPEYLEATGGLDLPDRKVISSGSGWTGMTRLFGGVTGPNFPMTDRERHARYRGVEADVQRTDGLTDEERDAAEAADRYLNLDDWDRVAWLQNRGKALPATPTIPAPRASYRTFEFDTARKVDEVLARHGYEGV